MVLILDEALIVGVHRGLRKIAQRGRRTLGWWQALPLCDPFGLVVRGDQRELLGALIRFHPVLREHAAERRVRFGQVAELLVHGSEQQVRFYVVGFFRSYLFEPDARPGPRLLSEERL